MTWQCPHCDEEIENVIRTGERRFHCEACNQVVKFDDVEPALDNQDVGYIDRRKEGNTGKKEDSGGGGPPQGGGGGPPQQPPPQQQQQQQQPPQQPEREPDHEVNERELIYEHGSRGLGKIKEERLNDWLDVTDGVGNKTKNRIAMLFGRNDRYQRDPNALYEMLNDQLKASPAYVNSIVQDVFAPEREHEDLLRDEGYVPWYDRPDGARMQPQQQINRQQQMRGGRGGGGQGSGGNYNQQQGPPQQYNQQAQGISREEAMHMMRQAREAEEAEEEEGEEHNGMRMARDKAVMKAADNFGGFFGTMQKVAEEALVEYARKNPEWLVENSDIFMKFFGGRGGPKESEQSPEDAKIDDAISDIQGGMGGMGGMQQQQPPYQQQQSVSPQPQFQPSPDTVDRMGNGSTQQYQQQSQPDNNGPPAQTPHEQSSPSPVEDESSEPPSHPTGDTTNAVESTNEHENQSEPEPEPSDDGAEEEGFDELFGDIAE